MLNDFIPIRHDLMIEDYPNQLTIVPLADAHYGSAEFNEVLWHRAIKRIQDDPSCFCVLVGDLMDNGLKNSVTNVYEALATPRQQKEWLISELKPIANKILGAVGGNHERRSIRDADLDPLYDVMLAIGREDLYRQSICFMQVRLCYKFQGALKERVQYSFAITHGAGGGQYIGSSANRVQTYGAYIEGIDCLITGHTHKPLTFPVSKLVFDGGAKTVLQRQFTVVVASSFLDYGGYPIEKLLTPTAQVVSEIRLDYSQGGRKELRVIQ